MKKVDLSIVIPAYNEEARIGRAILAAKKYLRERAIKGEIIVVDDGSKDKTAFEAKKFVSQNPPVRIIRLSKNTRKGGAVKRGILEGEGEIIAFMDADLSTPPEEFDKLLPGFREGFDVVIGSRATEGSKLEKHQKWYREWLGKAFSFLGKLLFVYGVSDTQCGFKAFKKEPAKKIFAKLTSYSPIFDMEALFLATCLGYKVKEVGVNWHHDPDTRLSYNFKKALAIFQELLRLKRHYRVFLPLKVKH